MILGEVAKLSEQVQVGLSILTQCVEDVHADWALCKWVVVGGVRGTNIYAPKFEVPKP